MTGSFQFLLLLNSKVKKVSRPAFSPLRARAVSQSIKRQKKPSHHRPRVVTALRRGAASRRAAVASGSELTVRCAARAATSTTRSSGKGDERLCRRPQ